MKKLLPVLLALLLLGGLMLAGCGDKEETETTAAPTETTAAPTETTAAPTETTAAPTETTAAPADSGDTYYLRWAQFATAVLEDSIPQVEMAENIATRTNGRCKVELFWSDSLVPMFDSMDAVRQGSAEMATFPFGPHGGVDARFNSSEMPLYYNTIEAQIEAQASLLPAFTDVFEERFNQKCLQVMSMLPLAVGSAKKPIETLADWDGLLTQTISPAVTDIVSNLGAVGAPASPLDVYELLQKGTVDATIQSLGKYHEAKLWEVCKHLTACMLISSSRATTVNLDIWNKMPKDIQDIIVEEADLAAQKIKDVTADMYYDYLEELSANMTVYRLPSAERQKWQETLKPVVDKMLADMGDFGQQVIDSAEAANAKYPYPY